MQKIIVMTNGWIIVGRVSDHMDSGMLILYEAKHVCRWGTTEGIGQLRSGPTDKTVYFDIKSEVVVYPTNIIYTVSCEGWFK